MLFRFSSLLKIGTSFSGIRGALKKYEVDLSTCSHKYMQYLSATASNE